MHRPLPAKPCLLRSKRCTHRQALVALQTVFAVLKASSRPSVEDPFRVDLREHAKSKWNRARALQSSAVCLRAGKRVGDRLPEGRRCNCASLRNRASKCSGGRNLRNSSATPACVPLGAHDVDWNQMKLTDCHNKSYLKSYQATVCGPAGASRGT